ncbi:unnamed protein product [Angiostrongylus costaricensis]|uniref:CitMHS domain-containing protein n=1 Tax=Angiostrongylus costaricensis TaxID=334426 RepID=A0A0R3PG49_ANGCS|nr:unnamed protein product [Angiostrongylus costaricensis]
MAVYWMTEVLPLAVTAMLPVVLFPLTGVMTCHDVAQQFINDTNFLFIGGLIMAAAVEKCNLHERVALSVLKMVGSEPKWIMLGFMIVTALLSRHNCSTADRLFRVRNAGAYKRLSTALVLCVCVAANIGGTGMLTGTPSNLVMVGQLPELFGDVETSLNYMTWFLFAFPLMCFCLAGAWCILTIFFLRGAPGKDARITEIMHKRYDDLPRISYAEKSVMFCFIVLLSLWMFRKPGFFKGFGELLPRESYTDSTSAMVVAVLLFILPSEKPAVLSYGAKEEMSKESHLMDWSTMQKNFPWSVVILLGGGFALASGW